MIDKPADAQPPWGAVRARLARPGRWRLSTRITAVVLACLVPLLVVVVLSYAALLGERRTAEVESVVLVGQTVAAVVDGFAYDIEGTTLAAALALGARDGAIDQAATGAYLDALGNQYPILRAIFLADLSGRVIAGKSGGEGLGIDLSSRPYVLALRAGADTVWSPSVAGIQTGEATVAFARVVHAPTGAPRAYLIVAFYPSRLLERLAVSLPADADVTFYDRRGVLMHSTERPDLPADRRDASGSRLLQQALAGQVVRLDGTTALYGTEPRFGVLVPVPRIGWVVAFSRPLGPLEAQLGRQLGRQAAAIVLVMLGAAWFLAWLTRRLVRPVTVLAGAAAAITRGERPSVPAVQGDADVEQLAAGMAAMSAAVAAREDALRRQSERLRVLVDASRSFAEAGLDPRSLLDVVARAVAVAVGDGCAISLLSDDGQQLELAALYHPDPDALALACRLMGEPRPIDGGLAVPLIERGEPVFVPDLSPAMREAIVAPENREYTERFGLDGLVAVPLRIRGRSVGALSVWRGLSDRAYSEDDLRLLQDLADRAALALENARLFGREGEARQEAERAAERTRRLQEITRQLSGSLEADEVLGAIARSAAELLDAPVGAVFLLDALDSEFVLAAAHGVPESAAPRLRLPRQGSLAGRAVDEARTIAVDDVRNTPGTALPALLTGQVAGSEVASPIVAGGERYGVVLGVVKVFSPTVRRFSGDDAAVLGALAAAAAVALTNARLYREARDAVRARDDFLSVAAHELKTPLTGLMGNVQLLARMRGRARIDDERLDRLTGSIHGSARRLAVLVDDLLDVSRIQSGQLALRSRPVDLVALVAELAAEHAEALDNSHPIETVLPSTGCEVEGDPDRLRQVLENLLDNAVKYSPSGGTVCLELSATDGDAHLRVSDQGIGLPPGATEAIFAPFGRAANAEARALPGMGLGLYICRNIAERHGGRMWAESAGENRGATMHLVLPIRRATPVVATASGAPDARVGDATAPTG